MTALEFNHTIIGLQPVLKMYTRRFTKDREESEDLLQDTILKALANREKFIPNSNCKAWLFTIMKNTFINKYRKKSRLNTYTDESEDQYHLNVADTNINGSPEKLLNYKELKGILANLKDIYLIPFQMYMEGFKYHEISEELDLPIGTIKTRIFHARQILKDRIHRN